MILSLGPVMAEAYLLVHQAPAGNTLLGAIWSGWYPTDDLGERAKACMPLARRHILTAIGNAAHGAAGTSREPRGKLPPMWNNRAYHRFS
jgi:hypothetical protein